MTPDIPGYQIQREIGKGGMGMVYRATREADGNVVALKILPPNLITPTTARRFQREGASLKALDHPNIVRVYEVGARDGVHFIAMEFVDGRPLSRVFRDYKGGLPMADVRRQAAQVAEALDVLHTRGMVHRDLKPANVILRNDGTVKLLDFGLVQVDGLTMLTATGNVVGTPAYMSPEQCAGRPLDLRADIYAFGLLLYEFVAGRPPFVSDNIYELLDQQKNATPRPPRELRRDLPADIESLIVRCLEKDPNQRPTSMGAIAQELRAEPGSLTIGISDSRLTPLETAAPRPGRRSQPGSGRIWLVAAAVLALAMGVWVVSPDQASALWERLRSATVGDAVEDVQQDFQDLARAEALFEEGRRLEGAGQRDQAYLHYARAVAAYPLETRYYWALSSIADRVGRRAEVRKMVRSYLARDRASDPGGLLLRWLEDPR